MRYHSGDRVQTAFRLRQELVGRLKREAARRSCSVNKLVESVLERATGLEWPSMPQDDGTDAWLDSMACCTSMPDPDDVSEDPRLAHILGI